MLLIYQTENFIIKAHEQPHVDREDGGHVVIMPKVQLQDRTELSPKWAIELMKLSMIAGEAMKAVLNRNGIDVERINYQENGNWKPELHWHLYGRAQSAKVQKFGDSLYFPRRETGFYDHCEPLTLEDCAAIRQEIERLWESEKYKGW
jgi:diadenosine tetraphosphate (Ap4A) HIT family hydrolase